MMGLKRRSTHAAVVKRALVAVLHLSVVEAAAFGRLYRRPECGDVSRAARRDRHGDGNGREEDEQASVDGHEIVSSNLMRPSGIGCFMLRHETDDAFA